MIIKLDTSILSVARDFKIEHVKRVSKPLTLKQKITVDRIVIAVLFLGVIAGAILFG